MGISRKKVPPHLYARYAIKPRRTGLIATAATIGLTIGGGVMWIIGSAITAGGDVTLISWREAGINQVEIRWNVHRADNQSVNCIVRVQDRDRFDVGYAVGQVRNTASRPELTVTVETRGEIYAVDTPTCAVGDISNLVGSHFRPGLLPPAQSNGLAAPWQPLTEWLN